MLLWDIPNMRNVLAATEAKRPYRFHILGLVHLPVSYEYQACAFTTKIYRMCSMLLSLGHEVYLYGAETSDAPCTEFIETHTKSDIRQEWGEGDNRFDLGYNWQKHGFRHDINDSKTKATAKYYVSAISEIKVRKRDDDFLLVMQGTHQKPISDKTSMWLTCEPGIGYRGSYARFRAFESAYIQNFKYGSEHPGQSVDGHYYDRVIPNYFDGKDFPFVEKKDDYFFYIGRMIKRKGIWTAIQATRAIGAKLIIAGQESNEVPASSLPEHCDFIGHVGPIERADIMGRAKGVFVPTIYLEPFGGVNVEAQLCGTPAITTNFGVFPETVVHGETGFRCDTLADFAHAARNVGTLDPYAIRKHAERYLMDNVKWEYQKWWDDIYQVYLSAKDPEYEGRGWSYIP